MRAPKPAGRKPPEPPPWSLPIGELNGYVSEVAAIRALAEGGADQYQQRMAIGFICSRLCGEGTMSFWPGGEDGKRASDFAEGRRWVAIQLRRIIALVPERFDPRGEPPPMPMARRDDEAAPAGA